MKRTPLKRKPSPPRLSYETFWRTVTVNGAAPCALRGVLYPCYGSKDAHHYVPKRRLRTDAAKLDARNGVCLCRAHHALVESAALRAPRPEHILAFLRDHEVTLGLVPPSHV